MRIRKSRTSNAGDARTCPHCKATILKSAAVCPVCQHALKFEAARPTYRSSPVLCPLSVQGTLRHSGNGESLEYSVLLEIHDQSGNVLSRQVVGVGSVQHAEQRIFSLRVEVFPDRSPPV